MYLKGGAISNAPLWPLTSNVWPLISGFSDFWVLSSGFWLFRPQTSDFCFFWSPTSDLWSLVFLTSDFWPLISDFWFFWSLTSGLSDLWPFRFSGFEVTFSLLKEQRKFERFDLQLSASVEAETSGKKKEIFSLITSNISAGGALFLDTKPLPEGTEVQLNLIIAVEKLKKLTNSQCHIKVKGTVIRSKEKGMAIRFQQNFNIMSKKNFLH